MALTRILGSFKDAILAGGTESAFSGSVASTGSFGSIYTDKNVNASAFVGDGSSLTGIDIPTAAAISGSVVSGVSGSVVSTGSFGLLQVDGANFTSASLARAIPAAGASDIDGLSDCLIEDNSIYIGNDPSGTTDTAQYNVAVGATALDSITTGDNNAAMGYNAGTALTDGDANVLIGYNAGVAMVADNDYNVAIGYNCLAAANGTENYNVAIGSNCLASLDADGSWGNIAIGQDAADSFGSTGTDRARYGNIFIGKDAGGGTWSDHANQLQNVAIGTYAMRGNISGEAYGNTYVGYITGNNNTSGQSNTAIGSGAGYSITTGKWNTCIGFSAGQADVAPVTIDTEDNTICLGNSNVTDFYCADSSISTSDGRDKTDIETFTHGLDFVNQMRPVTFRWDKRSFYIEPLELDEFGKPLRTTEEGLEALENAVPDGSKKKAEIQIGFIGQEVQAIEQQYGYSQTNDDGTPDEDTELVVDTNTKGLKMGLQYAKVVPILVNAIKELSAKVEALENA